VEAAVRKANTDNAKTQSDAKTAALTAILATAKTKMAGLPCAGSTPAELFQMLQYEFLRIPIIHNAPFQQGGAAIADDTDLFTTLRNGYLQNVIQRFVMGIQDSGHMEGEGGIMVNYLHYQKFK
jgi:hypothetical protein